MNRQPLRRTDAKKPLLDIGQICSHGRYSKDINAPVKDFNARTADWLALAVARKSESNRPRAPRHGLRDIVGANLAHYIKLRLTSPREMEKYIPVDRRTIERIRDGKTAGNIDTLGAIADHLKIAGQDLFVEQTARNPSVRFDAGTNTGITSKTPLKVGMRNSKRR